MGAGRGDGAPRRPGSSPAESERRAAADAPHGGGEAVGGHGLAVVLCPYLAVTTVVRLVTGSLRLVTGSSGAGTRSPGEARPARAARRAGGGAREPPARGLALAQGEPDAWELVPRVGSRAWLAQTLWPAAVALAGAGVVSDLTGLHAYEVARTGLARQPLDDAVHRWAPQFDHTDKGSELYRAPDLAVVLMLPWLALVVARAWERSSVAGALLMRRGALLYAGLLSLRAVCAAVTVVPSPVGSCRDLARLLPRSPPQSGTIISRIYCNDLVFSGHQTTYTFIALLVLLSDLPRAAKALALLMAAAGGAVSVLSRDHYSMDVLIGTAVTVLAVLADRTVLHPLLLGCVPAGAGGAQAPRLWELWSGTDNDSEDSPVARIAPGEERLVGRAEMPHARVSRRALRVRAFDNCLLATVEGRHGLLLIDPETGDRVALLPGAAFRWLPEQRLVLAGGDGDGGDDNDSSLTLGGT